MFEGTFSGVPLSIDADLSRLYEFFLQSYSEDTPPKTHPLARSSEVALRLHIGRFASLLLNYMILKSRSARLPCRFYTKHVTQRNIWSMWSNAVPLSTILVRSVRRYFSGKSGEESMIVRRLKETQIFVHIIRLSVSKRAGLHYARNG